MVEWEYRQVIVERPEKRGQWADNLVMPPKELSRMGTDEWELVTAFPLSSEGTTVNTVYIFKRPK